MNTESLCIFCGKKELIFFLTEKEEQEHFNFKEHIRLLLYLFQSWPIKLEKVLCSLFLSRKLSIFYNVYLSRDELTENLS